MKRSAIISFSCDPYVALYFKKFYERFWVGEVDELNVLVNGRQEFIKEFIGEAWKPLAENVVFNGYCSQGVAFNRLYPLCKGDVLITADSDNYVYQKGVIDRYAGMVERGECDYVGSTRPFLSFWDRRALDAMGGVDFDESHDVAKNERICREAGVRRDDYRFLDVMEPLWLRFSSRPGAKTRQVQAGNYPEYEHVGRMSTMAIAFFDYDGGRNFQVKVTKRIMKFFSRLNRVALLYHIFDRTKAEFPYPEFNALYESTFWRLSALAGLSRGAVLGAVATKLRPELKSV